jgi:hypothetical protein
MRRALCVLLSALLRAERAPIIDVHVHVGPQVAADGSPWYRHSPNGDNRTLNVEMEVDWLRDSIERSVGQNRSVNPIWY